MDRSIFIDQAYAPGEQELHQVLDKNYDCWKEIGEYVLERCPAAKISWHYSKAGWNCRISDHKRVLIYLMPSSGFFKASFVLGKGALQTALSSSLREDIKQVIRSAKVYAEGAGFRLPIKTRKAVRDLKLLVDIKLG